MNDLIRMLNLGGFSDIEKKIMEDNKVDFNKAIGNLLKSSRKSLNLHKCYYCKNDISGFCNSHSVPAFCLRNIAESGEVAYSNALIDFPLLKGKKGVNQAGTFNLICRDCDKKVFADYENPDNYVNYPTPKMIAQIALKDNLKFISRRLLEKEMYEYMCQNYNLPEKIKNEKQYVIDLDLKEYVNGFNKAKKAVIKNWDNEYLSLIHI